jgi:hypothetical protein
MSCNDVHYRDRRSGRSSWGLVSDHSVPPLSSESGVSDVPMQYHPTKLSRNATCSKDNMAHSPRASNADWMIFIAHQTDSPSQLNAKTRATKLAHRRRQGSLCLRGTLCRNGHDHVNVIATDNLFYAFS